MVGHQWLTPVILASQEAEIRRIAVGSQPRQTVLKTLPQKTLSQNWSGGVAQSEDPDLFKSQYHTPKKIELRMGSMAQVVEYLFCNHRP
jgi:hypothetical protein